MRYLEMLASPLKWRSRRRTQALDTLESSLGRAEDDAAVLRDPALTTQQKLDRLGEGGGQSPVEREIDNQGVGAATRRRPKSESLEEAQASGRRDGWSTSGPSRGSGWLALALLALVLPASPARPSATSC